MASRCLAYQDMPGGLFLQEDRVVPHHTDYDRWRLIRSVVFASGGLLTIAVGILLAHEGHAPLPSKGSRVDLARGHILLTRDARDALDVQSEEVGFQPASESLKAYASLVSAWDRHAFATSRLPGRIVKLHIHPGQHVKSGTMLAEVESQELEILRLELVNGEVEALQAAEVLALKRTAEGALPGQDVQEAETRMQQTRNALDIAKGKWLSLGLSETGLGELLRPGSKAPRLYMPIFSPISGTVIHSDLSLGKVIEPSEHLFEIVDLTRLSVRIDVLEKDIHRIALGQKIEVHLTAYPNEVFPGTVHLIGLHLDPATHLNAVWAELANPEGREPRLLPGMYGEAHIESPPSSGTISVPSTAFINDGVDRFVLVEAARTAEVSEFLKKSVTVVRESPDTVVLRTGSLLPGDRVVTRGSHELGNFFVPGVLRLSPETRQTIGLRVEPLGVYSLDSTVEVPASVEVPPNRRTTVAAPLSGAQLRIFVERGQQVKAGQVVAEVSSLEVQTLQLELLREHLTVDLLDKRVEQVRDINQLLARQRLVELRNSLAISRNRRDHLQERLTILGFSAEQLDSLKRKQQITAALPVRVSTAGIVVSFNKVMGQAIRADEPLFEVHDLRRPWVHGYVSEQLLPSIRLGQVARVRCISDTQQVLTGKVVRSGRSFGGTHRTLSVWVELDEEPDIPLRHNQMARLTLVQGTTSPTTALPHEAVVREGSQAFVFVQKEDGTLERRLVETGREDDRRLEVSRGLLPGEPVAVTAASALQTAYASLR